jgi:hypothetical protein
MERIQSTSQIINTASDFPSENHLSRVSHLNFLTTNLERLQSRYDLSTRTSAGMEKMKKFLHFKIMFEVLDEIL